MDKVIYYDNKRIELYKPVPPSRWEFTVFNEAGKMIAHGNNISAKRTAEAHARQFILYYRPLL
jgi:hypothetical protein